MNNDIDPLKGNVTMKFTLYGLRAHITTRLQGWNQQPSEVIRMMILMHRSNLASSKLK